MAREEELEQQVRRLKADAELEERKLIQCTRAMQKVALGLVEDVGGPEGVDNIDPGQAREYANILAAARYDKAPAPRPRLGVAVCVKNAIGQILLGRRAKAPNHGKWVIPGGGVEWGEDWQAAGEREMAEETGLDVKVQPFINGLYEIIEPDDHRVIILANGELRGAMPLLQAGSDLLEIAWFTRWQWVDIGIPNMSPHLHPMLKKYSAWGGV